MRIRWTNRPCCKAPRLQTVGGKPASQKITGRHLLEVPGASGSFDSRRPPDRTSSTTHSSN